MPSQDRPAAQGGAPAADGAPPSGSTLPAKELRERHASWLELFFDLVVIAAVAQLADRLHGDPSLVDVGLAVVLYVAVWLVWTSFMLYANVSATRTRLQAMLVGMAGIAAMAAAIPQATGTRASAFTLAYLATRVAGMRSWTRTGQALLSWPAAQLSAGLMPWIVSLWFDPPVRYWLWGLGVVVDLVPSVLAAGDPGRLLESMQKRIQRQQELRERQERRRGRPARAVDARRTGVTVARLDPSLLEERLGLFVIIVLGEAVAQVVSAAGRVDWTTGLLGAGLASFELLVGLWWLTFRYGFTAVPHFGSGELALRATLPTHLLTTMSITAVAVGLGGLAEHLGGVLPASQRWLLCGGLAAYFFTTGAAALLARAPARWLLGWALPSVVVPVLLGVFGGYLPVPLLPWLLAAVVAWQVAYGLRRHALAEAGVISESG
jgi:low temperature requirement protein LtrA